MGEGMITLLRNVGGISSLYFSVYNFNGIQKLNNRGRAKILEKL